MHIIFRSCSQSASCYRVHPTLCIFRHQLGLALNRARSLLQPGRTWSATLWLGGGSHTCVTPDFCREKRYVGVTVWASMSMGLGYALNATKHRCRHYFLHWHTLPKRLSKVVLSINCAPQFRGPSPADACTILPFRSCPIQRLQMKSVIILQYARCLSRWYCQHVNRLLVDMYVTSATKHGANRHKNVAHYLMEGYHNGLLCRDDESSQEKRALTTDRTYFNNPCTATD